MQSGQAPAFHPAMERVVFSGLVSKINKRGKRQERVFVCTNEAFYNLTLATGAQSALGGYHFTTLAGFL